jgi:hypothetical protein
VHTGCDDQAFILNTAIQHGTRHRASKVFSLFIDFARAFPSIPHNKLWDKLFALGVNSRFIRILQHIYVSLSTQIRLPTGYTDPIDLSEGLAQGEILSPILFTLFISDLEELLQQLKVRGIKIDEDVELHILLYADDMVVLCPSKLGLQMKIRRLEKYFTANGLTVHLAKTKVVVFRGGGRLPANLT